ncbi:MAG: universal stress protein [Oligoflexales bacterium]
MRFAWAFNPFDDNKKLQKKGLALLRAVSKSAERVEAVFVASPRELALSTAFDVPEKTRFSKYPKTILQKALKAMDLSQATTSVLTQADVSLTSAAKKLASYLDKIRADLTLVATYARQGRNIFTLGSFAETLVHYAKTDLLVFSENSQIPKGTPKSLLFAHDLSSSGEKALEHAIKYAKEWKASLHVLHIPDPVYDLKIDDQDVQMVKYRQQVQAKLEKIKARLKRKGVKGSASLAIEWNPVSDLIVKGSKKVSADMVMVTAKAGRLAALVGGSVTQQVLRTSNVPVIVIKCPA